MVVQLILATRMGTRELEDDEADENAFEISRELLTKFAGKAPPTKSQLQEAIEKAANDQKKEEQKEKKGQVSSEVKDDKVDTEKKPETSEAVTTENDKKESSKGDTDSKPVDPAIGNSQNSPFDLLFSFLRYFSLTSFLINK